MWESALIDISRKVAVQQQQQQQRRRIQKAVTNSLLTNINSTLAKHPLQKEQQQQQPQSSSQLLHEHTHLQSSISERISQTLPSLHKEQLERTLHGQEQNIQWDTLVRSEKALASTMTELKFQSHITNLNTSLSETQPNMFTPHITTSEEIIFAAVHYPFTLCAEVVCILLKAGKVEDALMLICNWEIHRTQKNLVSSHSESSLLTRETEEEEQLEESFSENEELHNNNNNSNNNKQKRIISRHARRRVVSEFVQVVEQLHTIGDAITLRAVMNIFEAAYKEQHVKETAYWRSAAMVYHSSQSSWLESRMKTLQYKLLAPLHHKEVAMLYYKAIEALCTLPTRNVLQESEPNSYATPLQIITLNEKLALLNNLIHVLHEYCSNSKQQQQQQQISLPHSLQRIVYTHIEQDPAYVDEWAIRVCPLLPYVCTPPLIRITPAELVCMSHSELYEFWQANRKDVCLNKTTESLSSSQTSVSNNNSNNKNKNNNDRLSEAHSWNDVLLFLGRRSRFMQTLQLKMLFMEQLLSAPHHVGSNNKKKRNVVNRRANHKNIIENHHHQEYNTFSKYMVHSHRNNTIAIEQEVNNVHNVEETFVNEFHKEVAQSITSQLYSSSIAERRRMCWHLLTHPQRHFLLHTILHLSLLDVFTTYVLTFRTIHRTSWQFAKACLLTVRYLCDRCEYEKAARIAWNHLSLECKTNARLFAAHPRLADYVTVSISRTIHSCVISNGIYDNNNNNNNNCNARQFASSSSSSSLLVLSPWMGFRTLAFLRLLHMADILTPMHCIPLCTCALNCGLHFQQISNVMDVVFTDEHQNVEDKQDDTTTTTITTKNNINFTYSNNNRRSNHTDKSLEKEKYHNGLKCWTVDMIRVCAAHREVQQASWPLYSCQPSPFSSSSSHRVHCVEWQRLMHSLYRLFSLRRKKGNNSVFGDYYVNTNSSRSNNNNNINYNNNIVVDGSVVNKVKNLTESSRIILDVPNRSRQQALWSLLYDKPTYTSPPPPHNVLKSLILALYLDEDVRNAFIMCDGWIESKPVITQNNNNRHYHTWHNNHTTCLKKLPELTPSMQALQQARSLLNYESAASLASSCCSYRTYKVFVESLRAKAAQWRLAHHANTTITTTTTTTTIKHANVTHVESDASTDDCIHSSNNNSNSSSNNDADIIIVNKDNDNTLHTYEPNDRLHHLLMSEIDQVECNDDDNFHDNNSETNTFIATLTLEGSKDDKSEFREEELEEEEQQEQEWSKQEQKEQQEQQLLLEQTSRHYWEEQAKEYTEVTSANHCVKPTESLQISTIQLTSISQNQLTPTELEKQYTILQQC